MFGFYAGVSLGSVDMTVEDISYGSGPFNPTGTAYGGFAGYNFQNGNLVFGAEVAASVGSVGGDDVSYLRPFDRGTTLSASGRIGYDVGGFVPYVSAGYMSSEFSTYHSLGESPADYAAVTATGTSYGAGVDYKIGASSFVRFGYSLTQYDDSTLPFYSGTDNHNLAASSETILVGYAFQF